MMSRTIRHSRFASSGRIDRFAIYGFFRLMQTPGEQLPVVSVADTADRHLFVEVQLTNRIGNLGTCLGTNT